MTREDIEFDINFGYWYNMLNEKFYSRWDLLFSLVQLVGGSGAAAGAISGSSGLVTGSGVVLAVCAAFSLAWQPGIKSERHSVLKKAFLELKGCMLELDDKECLKRLTELQKGETGMPSLNMAAIALTRRAMGDPYDDTKLTCLQRALLGLSK